MNGIKPDPDIKMDPDAGTPSGSGYMDDEFYEDTGELQLPAKGAQKDVWLTRIPDWLYDSLSKWETLAEGNDNDEIDIGEVIAFPDETGQGVSKTHPMRVILNERWRQKSQLPSAFQLDVQPASDAVLGNTYIFTEKDLPGYKPSGFGQSKMGGGSGNYGGVQDPKARIQKRSKYKKAIPKQTALVGHATRQYAATPLDTKEYLAFNAARIKQAIQGSNMRTNITEDDGTAEYDSVQKKFRTFIKPSAKPKAQLNKAARIAKNELIDLLHACFDEYKYWPMKALKARTKQPEAYLKEVLGDIAQLVRGGAFASNWMRLQMYNQNASNQKEDVPPEELGAGESDGEEEMEDVV